MHWLLNTAFCEEKVRIRAKERLEVFARIRQIYLNLIKE